MTKHAVTNKLYACVICISPKPNQNTNISVRTQQPAIFCSNINNKECSCTQLKNEADLERATEIFAGSQIKLTTAGQRHLGAVIGSAGFKEEYVTSKVAKWCEELHCLSEFAMSQPHAAFSAYLHGQQHKYSYFLRTIQDVSECFKPLDDAITNTFFPALFGMSANQKGSSLHFL